MNYQEKLNKAKGKQEYLQQQLKTNKEKTIELNKLFINQEKAQIFIQNVAKSTQEQLKYHIENIVQLALVSIFPDHYQFKVEFELKRGKTEARMFLINKEGHQFAPIDSSGGGLLDLISLALRITAWTLGKTRNTLILDEPLKHLSKNFQPLVAMFIKQLSIRLNLQFIIITHFQDELIENADKIFICKQNKSGISHIEEKK